MNKIYTSAKQGKELSKNRKLYAHYDYSDEKITWCSGCGNYKIQNALKRALAIEGIEQKDLLLCFDVGCNGNGSDKMGAYTIHGLHGRVLPLAMGCKLGNPNLNIVASAGDGATFSEGAGHIMHAIRNDVPMVFLHHDNSLYALTTGQPSAITPEGEALSCAPDGTWVEPLNALEVVLSLNPSFVARTFSGDTNHMTHIIQQALNHNGFAFVDILQVCTTYNRFMPQNWYWERIKYVEDLKSHDPTDIEKARKLVLNKDHLHLGLLYQKPNNQSFLDKLPNRQKVESTPVEEVKHYDVTPLLKSFY